MRCSLFFVLLSGLLAFGCEDGRRDEPDRGPVAPGNPGNPPAPGTPGEKDR